MLYFTRWKALAIILTALVVCLCAVPNFFPEATVKGWPAWAQRRLVLGLDLQGGSYLLLEVDSNYVRKEKLDQVRDDARRVLREAKIGYTGLASRPDSVEVRVKDTDVQTVLAKLRELSQPLGGLLGSSGQRSLEVSDAGGGLIRLTVPQAAITERIRQTIEQSIQIVERRVNQLGTVEPVIQRQGYRPHSGAGTGLAGSDPPEGAVGQDRENGIPHGRRHGVAGPGAAGPGAAGIRSADEFDVAEDPLCHQEAGPGFRRRPDRRAARASTSARASRSSASASIRRARANSRRPPPRMSGNPSPSCSTMR